MKKLVDKIFSHQRRTSYVHNKEDNILIFGAVASMSALVTGGFLFLYMLLQDVNGPVKLLGLIWMIYSALVLIGVELFEQSRKKAAAIYLFVLSAFGVLFGVGFFVTPALVFFTSILAIRYHHELHKN
jgi:chromate transport protein ChrA